MKPILLAVLAIPFFAAGCSLSNKGTDTSALQPSQVANYKSYDSRFSPVFSNVSTPFTFQYPDNWSVVEDARGGIEVDSFSTTKFYGGSPLPPGHFQMSITPEWTTGNSDDVAEWCRKQLTEYRNSAAVTIEVLSEHRATVAGLPAYFIDSKTQYTNLDDKSWTSDRQVCIAKGDTKMGVIGRPLETQYLPIFDYMLSTITFVR